MADKITRAGTFDGTVSFICYGKNKNGKQFIAVRCVDEKSGLESSGNLFCSERALEYTVEKLRDLGIEGDTARAVLMNADKLDDTPCTFETEENGDYVNVASVYKRGGEGFKKRSMDKEDFLAEVFGGDGTTKATNDEDNLPF